MAAWHRSLTLRLSAAFALLAIAVFAALALYLGRAADAHMAELDAHELHARQHLVAHIAAQTRSPEALVARLSDALAGEHSLLITVDGPQGPILRWPEAAQAEGLAALPSQTGLQTLPQGGRQLRALVADAPLADGRLLHIAVARDIHHHTDFLDQLQRDFQLAMLAAALLTIAVGVLIARHGLRPLRDMAAMARRISAGQLTERLPSQAVPPELAALVSDFNAMLDRLQDAFQRLSNFSADLAHELRTPLHSLRMQTEVSLSKARSNDDYRELLASNLEEYERLSRIIGDMLFLAKADNGLIIPQREAIALLPLCERLIDYYGLLAEHAELSLQGPACTVSGDRLMLERAIGNLLVNAIKHTPPGGRIVLETSDAPDSVRLSISNSGAAIPPDALPRLFDRFVRLSPDSEGNGLGLAITRSIILAHGGEISVSSDSQATRFTLKLAKAG